MDRRWIVYGILVLSALKRWHGALLQYPALNGIGTPAAAGFNVLCWTERAIWRDFSETENRTSFKYGYLSDQICVSTWSICWIFSIWLLALFASLSQRNNLIATYNQWSNELLTQRPPLVRSSRSCRQIIRFQERKRKLNFNHSPSKTHTPWRSINQPTQPSQKSHCIFPYLYLPPPYFHLHKYFQGQICTWFSTDRRGHCTNTSAAIITAWAASAATFASGADGWILLATVARGSGTNNFQFATKVSKWLRFFVLHIFHCICMCYIAFWKRIMCSLKKGLTGKFHEMHIKRLQ